MQYTYCPISREVNAIRQWNLVIQLNITWETFLLKNHTQNVVEKLFPDPFLKNQNWACLCINSLKFYAVCFYCMPLWTIKIYWNQSADLLLSPYVKLFQKSSNGRRIVWVCLTILWGWHLKDEALEGAWSTTLRKKCPYSELFWSVFSPNVGKYGPE